MTRVLLIYLFVLQQALLPGAIAAGPSSCAGSKAEQRVGCCALVREAPCCEHCSCPPVLCPCDRDGHRAPAVPPERPQPLAAVIGRVLSRVTIAVPEADAPCVLALPAGAISPDGSIRAQAILCVWQT